MRSLSRMWRTVYLLVTLLVGVSATAATVVGVLLQARFAGTPPSTSGLLAVFGGLLPTVGVAATAGAGPGLTRGHVMLVGLVLALAMVSGSGGYHTPLLGGQWWWAAICATAPGASAIAAWTLTGHLAPPGPARTLEADHHQ